jgi:ribonuclease Z
MRPLLHPALVNGRYGDPALYIETLFEKHAIMCDLGDISVLSPRKLLRVDQVYVSHAHVDHFIGFDQMLRRLIGRESTVRLHGPSGFINHVYHRLQGYRWNLIDRMACDLAFVVTEITGRATRTARLRLKQAFAIEPVATSDIVDGVVWREPSFLVTVALLDHHTPCLGFAIEETAHVNVWKSRLAEMGYGVGPWLRGLKRAVIDNKADDFPVDIGGGSPTSVPLGALRGAVAVTPGQKIAYVTDVADTPSNRDAIIALARNADVLFIEAAFAAADAALAAARAHLTTQAAGAIARAANVRRVEPFHFSPRYAGEEARMMAEVALAFAGK